MLAIGLSDINVINVRPQPVFHFRAVEPSSQALRLCSACSPTHFSFAHKLQNVSNVPNTPFPYITMHILSHSFCLIIYVFSGYQSVWLRFGFHRPSHEKTLKGLLFGIFFTAQTTFPDAKPIVPKHWKQNLFITISLKTSKSVIPNGPRNARRFSHSV